MNSPIVVALKRHLVAAAIVALAVELPPLFVPTWREAWLDAVVMLVGLVFLVGYAGRLGWRGTAGLSWWRRLGAVVGLLFLGWWTMFLVMFLIPGGN